MLPIDCDYSGFGICDPFDGDDIPVNIIRNT